jgi:hypothetical protein
MPRWPPARLGFLHGSAASSRLGVCIFFILHVNLLWQLRIIFQPSDFERTPRNYADSNLASSRGFRFIVGAIAPPLAFVQCICLGINALGQFGQLLVRFFLFLKSSFQ